MQTTVDRPAASNVTASPSEPSSDPPNPPIYDVSSISIEPNQVKPDQVKSDQIEPDQIEPDQAEREADDDDPQTGNNSLRYDPEAIAAYYSRRPLQVWARTFNIFWPMFMFVLTLLWDKQLGQIEKKQRQRAIQVRELITRLGPAYIKVGQALSTRPDLVPASYLDELSRLQDQIPPFANELAFQFIEEELGQHPDQIYAELSDQPIAAASLGQVYKGKLKTGETVAVKVQRPDLAERIALDIHILRQLSALAQRWIKRIRSDLVAIMDEFGMRIFEEMDYINEGQNAEKFASLYGNLPDIYVPKIYWPYTNRRVLTMEWINGTKLTQPEQIREQGVDARYLVEMGVQCSLRQLLEHGFFHADPHPGNLLATPDGKLAYLDFGMMSQVKPKQRYGLLEAVVHLVNRDFDGLAKDYVKLEFLTPDVDLTPIIPAFADVFGDALGSSVASLNFKSITDQLSDLMYEYPFRVPAYYALIIRSLVTLEGIAIKVDPDFKVLSKAYPYVAKRLLTDQAPELRASLQDLLFRDETFRWNRLENLLRNASNSQDYDLSQILEQTIDFIFSERGAFIREYLSQEIINAADDLGRSTWQQMATRWQHPMDWAKRDWQNINWQNINWQNPLDWSHLTQPPAPQPQSTSQPPPVPSSNLEHIIRILGILRDTPGFEPKLIINLVPRLVTKPELQHMGADIVGQLTQRAIARFIREFFLEEPSPHQPTAPGAGGGESDRKALPSTTPSPVVS